MPTATYKILGQSNPASASLTTIYTVPSNTSTVLSTLSVCNMGASTTFRVAVSPSGSAIANQHYLVYDNYVNQYDSVLMTLGITLATTDLVRVYAGSNSASFSVFGTEITP